MGIEEAVRNAGGGGVRDRHKKLQRKDLCPGCGEKAEPTDHWYWRCTQPLKKCEVLTYVPTDPTLGNIEQQDSNGHDL